MSASEVDCSDAVGAESWRGENGPNNVARRRLVGNSCTEGDWSSPESTR